MARLRGLIVAALLLTTGAATAHAQGTTDAKAEEKPKTLLEEIVLFGYLENSVVWNLGRTSSGGSALSSYGDQNTLRLYDVDEGYTFNMAELSIKKDPSERYPFGFGLVATAGEDARKNHAVGIFRDLEDLPRDTKPFDLQEAYLSYKVPLGSGLTVKAGKFVTLLGYEVIESPNNLNFSRSFLFGLAIPFTHVGGLLSYSVTDWFSITAGLVEGWDVADDNNGSPSFTGQFALTPFKDLTTTLNWIAGPEQNANDNHTRWVADLVVNYTGIDKLTLGANLDLAGEDREPSLVGVKSDTDASWWGFALYAAYDWTEKLRTALRFEYFDDADGVRTLAIGPGQATELCEFTATVQYKIWRGLVGRLEYRHDSANEKVFAIKNGVARDSSQDTLSIDLFYTFF
jgi:hypothetical protein